MRTFTTTIDLTPPLSTKINTNEIENYLDGNWVLFVQEETQKKCEIIAKDNKNNYVNSQKTIYAIDVDLFNNFKESGEIIEVKVLETKHQGLTLEEAEKIYKQSYDQYMVAMEEHMDYNSDLSIKILNKIIDDLRKIKLKIPQVSALINECCEKRVHFKDEIITTEYQEMHVQNKQAKAAKYSSLAIDAWKKNQYRYAIYLYESALASLQLISNNYRKKEDECDGRNFQEAIKKLKASLEASTEESKEFGSLDSVIKKMENLTVSQKEQVDSDLIEQLQNMHISETKQDYTEPSSSNIALTKPNGTCWLYAFVLAKLLPYLGKPLNSDPDGALKKACQELFSDEKNQIILDNESINKIINSIKNHDGTRNFSSLFSDEDSPFYLAVENNLRKKIVLFIENNAGEIAKDEQLAILLRYPKLTAELVIEATSDTIQKKSFGELIHWYVLSKMFETPVVIYRGKDISTKVMPCSKVLFGKQYQEKSSVIKVLYKPNHYDFYIESQFIPNNKKTAEQTIASNSSLKRKLDSEEEKVNKPNKILKLEGQSSPHSSSSSSSSSASSSSQSSNQATYISSTNLFQTNNSFLAVIEKSQDKSKQP